MKAPNIWTLVHTTEASPDFLKLSQAMDQELVSELGESQAELCLFNRLQGIRNFFVGYLDGTPAACGALKVQDPRVWEVKRIFVVPEFRRNGLARKIMEALESTARNHGVDQLVLETDRSFLKALRLYQSLGFTEIPKFEPYINREASVCLGKPLI